MGTARLNIVDIDLSAESYASGGISISAAKLGMNYPGAVLPAPAAGYIFEYDHDNRQLKAFPATSSPLMTLVRAGVAGADSTDGENTDEDTAPESDDSVAARTAVAAGDSAYEKYEVTITGTATDDGTLTITLDGVPYELDFSDTDSAEAVATAFAALEGGFPTWSVSRDTAVLTFTSENLGPRGTHEVEVTAEVGIEASGEVDTEGEWPTWALSEAVNDPDIQRSVCIVIENDSGGALNLYEGVMTFTVTGTKNGEEVTDLITFTSEAEDKEVVTSKFRFKYGVVPFDTIEGVTLDNYPDVGLKIGVGLGPKVGLPGGINSEDDLIRVILDGSEYDFGDKVDEENDTVDLGDFAEEGGSDLNILYRPNDESFVSGAGGVLSEVPAGTAITASIRCIAVGI